MFIKKILGLNANIAATKLDFVKKDAADMTFDAGNSAASMLTKSIVYLCILWAAYALIYLTLKSNAATASFANYLQGTTNFILLLFVPMLSLRLWIKSPAANKMPWFFYTLAYIAIIIDTIIYTVAFNYLHIAHGKLSVVYSSISNISYFICISILTILFFNLLHKIKLLHPKKYFHIYAPVVIIIFASASTFFYFTAQWHDFNFTSFFSVLNLIEPVMELFLFIGALLCLALAKNRGIYYLSLSYAVIMAVNFMMSLNVFSQSYGGTSVLEAFWILGLFFILYALHSFYKDSSYKKPLHTWVEEPNTFKVQLIFMLFLAVSSTMLASGLLYFIILPHEAFKTMITNFFPFFAFFAIAIVAISNILTNMVSQPLQHLADITTLYVKSELETSKIPFIHGTQSIKEFSKIHNFIIKALVDLRNVFDGKMTAAKILGNSIAHEMKNPLQKINGNKDVMAIAVNKLMHGNPSAEDTKKYFAMLTEGIDNIDKTVKDAAAIIDLILGSIKLEKIDKSKFKNYYISSTIEDALDEYPFQGNERSLVHWEKGEDFTYQGNKIYTKLILQNLIKNSIYFIRETGHGEIFIKVISSDDGKHNRLIFKDTACGISSEDLPHVFEAFYSKRQGGSGLGLSFCKRIMESYGGNITIQSSTQKGSEFTEFTLLFPIL